MRTSRKLAALGVILAALFLLGQVNLRLYTDPISIAPDPVAVNIELLQGIERPETPEAQEFQVSQTMTRPVFSPSRRPPKEAVREKPSPAPEPATTSPVVVEDGRNASEFSLLGVMKSIDGGGRALILAPSQPGGVWIAQGAAIDGWRIDDVGADSVTISRSGEKYSLKLYVDKPPR